MSYKDVKKNNCGIYIIKNIKNGKLYIGQSHNISWRWAAHKSALRFGRCPNKHLQSAWHMYGESAFVFSILELCAVEELDNREEYWIKHFDTTNQGYNIRSGGNSSRGWKMSDDGRRHISESLKGKKKPEWVRKCISDRQKRYYKDHIPSTSKQIVCLNTGEVFTNASVAHVKYESADISAIHKQCKGNSMSCGKTDTGEPLVWAYLDDYNQMTIEEIKTRLSFVGRAVSATKNQKSVKCVETGMVFESCKDAASYAGVSQATISDCLHGRSNFAGRHPETGKRLSWALAS